MLPVLADLFLHHSFHQFGSLFIQTPYQPFHRAWDYPIHAARMAFVIFPHEILGK
jgi:hypothetical protein